MPRVSKVTREDRQSGRTYLCRSRKRFNPNKIIKDETTTKSASSKKIKFNTSASVVEDVEKHYRIVDFLLVFSTIASLVKCAQCDGSVEFKSCKKEGLGFQIQVKCANCDPRFIPSSEKSGHRYEINTRFAFVMRTLGLGLAGCNKFCGLMDMASSFLSKPSYGDLMKSICCSIKTTGKKFLVSAADEEKQQTRAHSESDILTVSGDGTWHKQGFSSAFGVTSLIGYWSGKVIDIFISSSQCQACKLWRNKLNTVEFDEWYEEHIANDECQANHTGPSGNMEVNAVIELFRRSEKNYGAKIGTYIGDGDSKTYGNLVKAKPYGENFLINKKECVGHVQKRMGKRLRDLVAKTVEDTVVKTGKNAGKKRNLKILGGKGKLTGKVIDNLTRYYGAAIRNNCDSLEGMKNAIWATFYHQQSTDDNPQHHRCMSGENSWCRYQKALATTGVENFKHDYTPLPQDVIQAIKPIYEDLSKDELLERCLGGFTQNANESLNQLIWRIAPKKLSGSRQIVEFASYVATCTFNEGAGAFLTFLSDMNVSVGPSAHDYVTFADNNRIDRAEIQANQQSKEARITERLARKEAQDIDDAAGSLLYGAGIDDSV